MFKKRIANLVLVLLLLSTPLIFTACSDKQPPVLVNVEAIKKIAELAVIEYHITTYEQGIKYGKLDFLHLIPAKYMVLLKGNIKGSVDLNKASIVVPDDPANKKVKITFQKGAIKVSNPEFGPDDIQLIQCTNPDIFNPITDADRNVLIKSANQHLKQIALADGIKQKTIKEASTMLEIFLLNLGYGLEIKFEDK